MKIMIGNCKIGMVGIGNMGKALLEGLVAAGDVAVEHITAVDIRTHLLQPLREQESVPAPRSSPRCAIRMSWSWE